ncbi:MAG: hypothetical protein KGZ86_04625, partial [Candidatus Latescibacteria bacterium]|nr:hypothetical protein [Candidatus Latescibacterota bacterium]
MRRAREKKSKSRIALSIILLCLALFVIISLLSYHFFSKQISGVIGASIGKKLADWFNYCAYALPILLALFAIERLGVQWIKKQFGFILLWLVGISLFAGALSYAIGFASPLQNYGGLIGAVLSRFLFDWLGFLLTFFISLFLLFGLLPY